MVNRQSISQRRITQRSFVVLSIVIASALFAIGVAQHDHVAVGAPPTEKKSNASPDEAASRDAFLAAYKVLMHARCMNCHPKGDVPLQGDDSHLHSPPVKRGTDGKGKFAMKCANCHQEKNARGANTPPGNPNWHLPQADMPLVFEGKSPRELAMQLKDPKLNGGKTLEQILHHVTEDKLVLAGWDPGEGRTKPPLTHEEFVAKMTEWIEKGAAIPE